MPSMRILEITEDKKTDRLSWLLDHTEPVPKEWLTHRRGESGRIEEKGELLPVPCSDYSLLIASWQRAMRWTDGLDVALSCMMASILSTRFLGDQLWMKIMGPASCGKSTLCEALSIAKKYVFAKSTFRGFHSGGGGATDDFSLLKMLNNKTFITKDGDTLLQTPNLSQILSEGRDIYDRTSRTHYRNKGGRDYEGINMTWLLCGTNSLRKIDSSELGERFLDCVIMESIDNELEDEVLWLKVNQADAEIQIESNGSVETRYTPDMREVMQLTGGYVIYLQENSKDLLASVDNPEWARRRCMRLGKFVAFMRARPSRTQREEAEREFAARLVSQHVRLSKCLAVVMGKKEVDEEVMRRTTKVALDTARGISLEITKLLYSSANDGISVRGLEMHTGSPFGDIRTMLRFLMKIGAVAPYTHKWETKAGEVKQRPRWRLTKLMYKLFRDVYRDPVL